MQGAPGAGVGSVRALAIRARAEMRLAEEYDEAQDRGEVVGRKGGGDSTVVGRNAATAADLGLRRDEIHEARKLRDAEREDFPKFGENLTVGQVMERW